MGSLSGTWLILLLIAALSVALWRRFRTLNRGTIAAELPRSTGKVGNAEGKPLRSGRHVFICHCSADSALANEIVDRIEQTGTSCWIAPRDIEPGVYAESLYSAIEASVVFVVLMSRSANASKAVVRELEIADSMNTRVVPVLLEDFEPTGAFCYYTRATHLFKWYEDQETVIHRIGGEVSR